MAGNKNCPFCGGSVDNEATTCNQCGGPLKKAPASAAGNPLKVTHCPQCNASVSPGDILCMSCGTNLLTGQKVATPEKKEEPVAGGGVMIAAAKWVSAALIALVLAGMVVFTILYWLRDPVGEALNQARAGNLLAATETLQNYIQKYPDKTEAQFLLGKVYWQGQSYDKAAEHFAAVAKKGESNARDALLLSLLASEELVGNAPEQREKQLALLNSLLNTQFAGDGELQLLQSLLEGKLGNVEQQRRAMDEALINGATATDVLPVLSYALNEDLTALDRFVQRKEQREETLSPEARATAGIMRLAAGETEAGVAELIELPSISPHVDGWVKLELGAFYMQQGEYGKALPFLSDARHQQPENERAVFLHALCLQENKLIEEALTAFDQITTARKTYAGAAALQQAQILAAQGHVDRASAMVREAGDLGLNTARQATIQGQIFMLQGDATQAEQAYRRALSMSSSYAPAYLELGLLLIGRNATQEGLAQLDIYLELAKADPIALHANEIELLVAQIRQSQE